MIQLSYASIPHKSGKEVDLRKVPRDHRKRVKDFCDVLASEKWPFKIRDTQRACNNFLDHSISERLVELTPVENPEILKMQERFKKSLGKANKIMIDSMDAHSKYSTFHVYI